MTVSVILSRFRFRMNDEGGDFSVEQDDPMIAVRVLECRLSAGTPARIRIDSWNIPHDLAHLSRLRQSRPETWPECMGDAKLSAGQAVWTPLAPPML